jgi:squalene synthase HpnC
LSQTSTDPAVAYTPEQAYAWCRELAQSHYENFPVASWLLPREMRDGVAAIYAFARLADDIADEGDGDIATRFAQLDNYAVQLDRLPGADDPVFIALADLIPRYKLPTELFHDLLSAFRQDVTTTRYPNFDAVLDYCRRSANPVGRLLLHLNGSATEENLRLSDQICSALQLINFMQDLEQDYRENNRIYLPQDEMATFGVSEQDIASQRNSAALSALIDFQLERIRKMMFEGSRLGGQLHGRFGLEIRLIIEAGIKATEKLTEHGGDVFSRPRLTKMDYLRILWHAMFKKR